MRTLLAFAASVVIAATCPARQPEIDLQAALAGQTVQVVLVKDFMRLQNDGMTEKSVEFERYLPTSDSEQFVLDRWIDARMDGGATTLPVSVVSVRTDEAGNLIQRIRIAPLPGKTGTRVTLTSLVARRERPMPTGDHPIPAPADYPAEVQQFLKKTPTGTTTDPVVKRTAAAILEKAHDTLGVAHEIARIARERTYLPSKQEPADTLAGLVLLNGGSCCASAVAAMSVFRACGIPAQITYCPPPSYVHGIVRFWVQDYGWVRMDATSGTGKMPLTQDAGDLALVRLFDMPLAMESVEIAWAWPYHNTDEVGMQRFFCEGQQLSTVRFAARDEAEAAARGGVAGFVDDPFQHLEPGSWSTVLASERLDGPWANWDELSAAAQAWAASGKTGTSEAISTAITALPAYREQAKRYEFPDGAVRP